MDEGSSPSTTSNIKIKVMIQKIKLNGDAYLRFVGQEVDSKLVDASKYIRVGGNTYYPAIKSTRHTISATLVG